MSDGFDWGSIDWSSTYGGLTEEDAAEIREANTESNRLGTVDLFGFTIIGQEGGDVLDPESSFYALEGDATLSEEEARFAAGTDVEGLMEGVTRTDLTDLSTYDLDLPGGDDLADALGLGWLSWFKWVALIAILLYLAKPGLEIGANLTE